MIRTKGFDKVKNLRDGLDSGWYILLSGSEKIMGSIRVQSYPRMRQGGGTHYIEGLGLPILFLTKPYSVSSP